MRAALATACALAAVQCMLAVAMADRGIAQAPPVALPAVPPAQPPAEPPTSGGAPGAEAPKGGTTKPPFDMQKAVDAARATVKQFTDRIKGELTSAIKADGVANSVSLCQTISPDISTSLSDETGFEVSRTSLKLRNPENSPGPWELAVLRKFQEQATAGGDPARLEHYEIVSTSEGDKLFRYMKGIPTAEICLACHGTDLKADVKAELVRYYPDDKAIGYQLGELRGAFSLVKLID